MKVEDLQDGYYMFGNKGTVWSDSAHIAGSGSTTLCGTPMLSTNWARIEALEGPKCPECLTAYSKETKDKTIDVLELTDVLAHNALENYWERNILPYSMHKDDEADILEYTDYAQGLYDCFYDEYADIISRISQAK
jgi:hypothetical protein